MPDTTARLNALVSGQIDAALLDPKSEAQAKSANLVETSKQVDWQGLLLLDKAGKQVKALADPKVRQAMNYAIDRKGLLDAMLLGRGTVTSQVFGGSTAAYDKDLDVDHGNGVTGTFITATHDLVGTDRFEILGEAGKIVVEDSNRVTITRLVEPERELSDAMGPDDVARLFRGQIDPTELYTQETLEFTSEWGQQHSGVLENFARHILDGTPLLAPGEDGIAGVRLANAIHLSSWLGREVPLDFDPEQYLAELNRRIADEGLFPQRETNPERTPARA